MENTRNPYDYFLAALLDELAANWKGKQKILADRAGISIPYLSELKKRKSEASNEVQGRICDVIGIKFEDFISKGRAIKQHSRNVSPQKKITAFPSSQNDRFKAAMANLQQIFDSGDMESIEHIENCLLREITRSVEGPSRKRKTSNGQRGPR